MVSRSAYAQLGYSPWLLAGTHPGHGAGLSRRADPGDVRRRRRALDRPGGLAGDGDSLPADAAVLSTALAARALALPAIGALYTVFTLQSAIDVWRGRGGMWKGRAQALVAAR